MKNSLQNISSGTLFASAIISFFNLLIALISFTLPLFIVKILAKGVTEKNEWLASMLSRANLFSPGQIYTFIFAIIIFFISTILIYKAMKRIRAGVKIRKWSITALIASVLLIYLDGTLAFLAGVLGVIGSTTGLISTEGKVKTK